MTLRSRTTTLISHVALTLAVSVLSVFAVEKEEAKTPIPKHDGKPADMTKPVQVFILLGQSNMVGMGRIPILETAVKTKGKYAYMVDDAGKWVERKDVRFVRYMSGKGPLNNEWMCIKGGTIGPEYGIGHVVGNAIDAPVMILKCCIGNRSLGWDLLPPGSERFEEGGKVYAGYKDSPDVWVKGTEPKKVNWYAGKQYDDDVGDAKKALADLEKHYPGAKGFEVAGFFMWQGEKDGGNAVHSAHYEQNLVNFIKSVRKDFNAPNAKFVMATIGEIVKGSGNKVMEGQFAADGTSGKHPEFKGNVATVYSHPMAQGGGGNGHYGGNAEVYMDVGEAMGKAMVELLGTAK
ncbi:MAG: sialate O-acetylesterase [Planctomycetota bacterium]